MANKNTPSVLQQGTNLIPTSIKPTSTYTVDSQGYPTSWESSRPSNKIVSPVIQPLSSVSSQSTQSTPFKLKYALLIILLIFLILTLVLYLIKPGSTKIIDIYAPIITFFSRKKDTARVDFDLENIINDKINSDNEVEKYRFIIS